MPRVAAWAALRSGSPTPLREVDRVARERGLDPRDRALVRQLVGTELRRRGTLRALVRTFTERQPSADLTAHLHLGLVQLLWLDRVPDHAAVSSTVAAAGETCGVSKGPLMNGVLRNVIRARCKGRQGDPRRDLVDRDTSFTIDVFRDPLDHPFLWAEDAYSLPAPLMKRWTKRHGRGRAMELARTFLNEPPLSLRAVRAARSAVQEELAAAGVETRPGAHPDVLVAPSAATAEVTQSAAFREGRVTVQGATAVAAAGLLQAREGEELLDLCAAPGGKTMILLEAGARVTACDLEEGKLARIAENAERLGLTAGLERVESDADAALPEGRLFDGVLVDAPCSNTGVLGARPGARWRFGPQSQRRLGELQTRLLRAGAARVKPGGRLVWSTCSLEPEENEQFIRAFLAEVDGWVQEEELATLPATPDSDGPHDGGYAVRLRRT